MTNEKNCLKNWKYIFWTNYTAAINFQNKGKTYCLHLPRVNGCWWLSACLALSFAIYKFFNQLSSLAVTFVNKIRWLTVQSALSQNAVACLLCYLFRFMQLLRFFLWFLFVQQIYSINTSKFLSPMKLADTGPFCKLM